MKKETEYALQKLKQAFLRLKEGVAQVRDELDQDGVIQRFEFTFELLWKLLKIYLEEEKGVLARTPKEALKEAFRLNLFEEENPFLDMLQDRNKMSHIYNKEESDAIFQRIKDSYLSSIEKLLQQLGPA